MASLRRYVLASTDLLLSPRRESRSGRVSDSASKPAVALFITGRGGGGHKAAAAALHDCLQQDGAEWASAIEMVDGQRLFDEAIAGGGKGGRGGGNGGRGGDGDGESTVAATAAICKMMPTRSRFRRELPCDASSIRDVRRHDRHGATEHRARGAGMMKTCEGAKRTDMINIYVT